MKTIYRTAVLIILVSILSLPGCATPGETLKTVMGTSTRDVETARKDALSKVLDYDYKTCCARVEAVLAAIPHVSIYAKNKDMIAFYHIDPDTTPVGVFFTEVDPSHTRVEISSASAGTKEFIAKKIFAE